MWWTVHFFMSKYKISEMYFCKNDLLAQIERSGKFHSKTLPQILEVMTFDPLKRTATEEGFQTDSNQSGSGTALH